MSRCIGCEHERDKHRAANKGGCGAPGCLCPIYTADGVAWAIQTGSRWMQFGTSSATCWPCTNLGDARVFAHPDIAEDYVRRFHKEGLPWVVRELLTTPIADEAGPG